jgi:5'-nucleotidase
VLAACGGSDDDDAAPRDGDAGATTTAAASSTTSAGSTTTGAAAEPLVVLVTNDDGYAAEGIDALVTGLDGVDGLELVVAAPSDQRSGTGGKSTPGDLATTDVALAGGHPATAVDGFPADSVRVAFEELGVEPDLVVSGINEGQNVGPFVDLSGTVGAARAAVARGVPALAVSQGTGEPFDYGAAVPFVLDWIAERRDSLAAGEEPVAVTNLNVPSCDGGEVRGLVEVEPDADAPGPDALAAQDCSSTQAVDGATGDVDALLAGYATISTVPDEPGG